MSPSKKPAKTRKTAAKKPKAAARKPKAAPAAKKAAAKKPAPAKKAPAAKKAPEAKPVAAKAAKAPKAAKAKARKKGAASAKAQPTNREAKPGLGYKWACFHCGAKFYDLGKPDPICPRCHSDQREQPESDSPPPPPPPPRKPAQPPMARYLDEEDAPADESFVDEGEEEAAEIDIEAIEETGTFVEPDYEDE
jgi:hypothetical protein